jgi:hypothetical protein
MLNTFNVTIIDPESRLERSVSVQAANSHQAHKDVYFDMCSPNEEVSLITVQVGDQHIEVYNEHQGFVSEIF